MSFLPEPAFAHDRTPRIGVLLVNLGTPDEATPAAVRRYLPAILDEGTRAPGGSGVYRRGGRGRPPKGFVLPDEGRADFRQAYGAHALAPLIGKDEPLGRATPAPWPVDALLT